MKLAPEDEWLFELGYMDPAAPDKPTHVLAGIWESAGFLAWTKHPIRTHVGETIMANPNDPALDAQMKDVGAQIEALEDQIEAALAADPDADVSAFEADLEAAEDRMKVIQDQRRAHRKQVLADRKAVRDQAKLNRKP